MGLPRYLRDQKKRIIREGYTRGMVLFIKISHPYFEGDDDTLDYEAFKLIFKKDAPNFTALFHDSMMNPEDEMQTRKGMLEFYAHLAVWLLRKCCDNKQTDGSYLENKSKKKINIEVKCNPYFNFKLNQWENDTKILSFPEWAIYGINSSDFFTFRKDKQSNGVELIKRKYELKFNDELKKAIERKEFIEKTLNKVYYSRSFPPSLRVTIFERDQYTCQICLATHSKIKERGHSLEVDHIVEWEDGGLTTYTNGRTVCSDCNKGKHHAKHTIRKQLFVGAEA